MNLFYELEGGLYVNLTNRCNCACRFCIRRGHEGLGDADSLWLDHEPSEREVFDALAGKNLDTYREVVFCGYGEPTLALDLLLSTCRRIKAESRLPVRLNTNGLGTLANGRPVPPLLRGLVDTVSVSLNASTAEAYARVTCPSFGEAAFDAMLRFVRECRTMLPHVTVTAVDVISPQQVRDCQALAGELGVTFRLRHFT